MTISSREQVAETVRGFVAGELNIDAASLDDGTVLKQLPGADSVRLLRIVSKLERHCDTEFDDEDIFSSTTLDDLITLVHGYVTAGV